jgi:hypothetical protein
VSELPPDKTHTRTTERPPVTALGVLRRLGPGLIVAGSIVGSGELIATTKTGAEAGFWLLWLIIIGCVIKVFVQVEFGRYSIVNGQTTMAGLNSVPGPVLELALWGSPKSRRMRGNWIVWYWFLMWLASIGQLGGIVGGVGQALAISVPLTTAGREFNEYVDHRMRLQVAEHQLDRHRTLQARDFPVEGRQDEVGSALSAEVAELSAWVAEADTRFRERLGAERLRNSAANPRHPTTIGSGQRLWPLRPPGCWSPAATD